MIWFRVVVTIWFGISALWGMISFDYTDTETKERFVKDSSLFTVVVCAFFIMGIWLWV